MPDRWYRFLATVVARLYYRRIHVLYRERLPRRGPVLYVGLHRNGAVDGLIYKSVLPRATFLIAAQLVRSALGRLFFAGIPVARAKDADDRRRNPEAVAAAVAHLAAGGELFVLPEGTSDLGPRHLPFRTGAARILAEALAAGVPVRVVPVAIFYSRPEAFRSEAIVVCGEAVATALDPVLDAAARVAALHERITAALEALGVNATTGQALDRIERMAAVVAEGDPRRYYRALKVLERREPPPRVAESWDRLDAAARAARLATERGVPVLSRRGVAWNAAWLAVQAPLVALAGLANAVPVAGAALAGRRLADARNTVALWRLLVGTPLAALWLLFVLSAGLLVLGAWSVAAYLAVTAGGLVLYPELVARWPRFRNALSGRALSGDLESVRAWLAAAVPVEETAPPPAPLMLHEIAFGVMFAVIWGRLAMARGVFAPVTTYWLLLAAVAVAVVAANRRRPGVGTWRLRLGAYFVLMNVTYLGMGDAVAGAGTPLRDSLLQRVDAVLFGGVLPVLADRWKHAAVTDAMSFCYLLFFPYLTFSVGRQLWRVPADLATAQRFSQGLFCLYAVGFLGYFFVPARGAYLDIPGAFAQPIAGGWLTRVNEVIVRQGTNHVDVFPSLHVAVSAFLLWFDARTARWRYWAYLVPAVGLWLSTIYLRYHYGIDVVCGFALAAASVVVAFRASLPGPDAARPAVH